MTKLTNDAVKRDRNRLLTAVAVIVSLQLICLIVHWISHRIQREPRKIAPEYPHDNQIADLVNNDIGSPEQECPTQEPMPKQDSQGSPSPIVQSMYLCP